MTAPKLIMLTPKSYCGPYPDPGAFYVRVSDIIAWKRDHNGTEVIIRGGMVVPVWERVEQITAVVCDELAEPPKRTGDVS